MSDLLELSAVDAVTALQSGEFTAEEYARVLLDQCERGKVLNAFITLDRDQVLAAARAADQRREAGLELGPLHGLPIPIKDSINTKDLPTTAGTLALRDFVPNTEAPIVRMLREAGAIVLGKTNLHELSMGWTSNNLAFGAVHNPYDLARIPGGSSGGTAAAVAARMAPLGLAEDTEGSIRVPAALCGITGFRPTTFRYPSTGAAPISALLDQVGPHARNVGDLALFDSVITGDFDPINAMVLKGIKLGVPRGYWFAGLDPEVERISNKALAKLKEAGVELVEIEVDDVAYLTQRTAGIIQLYDFFRELPIYLRDSRARVSLDEVRKLASPELKDFFALYGKGGRDSIREETYRDACGVYLPRLRQSFRDYFAKTGVTAIVFPTTMVPAPFIGEEDQISIAGRSVSFITAIARNIAPGSTAGLPGLVLPAGLTEGGLPVSLEFDGPSGTDRKLLSLGLSTEKVLGRLPAPDMNWA